MLTAHPTEVQRKSILDCQLIISSLLSERDRMDMTPDDLADNEEALRRFVLILWQTRMLRTAKLTVHDEIKNGLAYLPLHLPRRDSEDLCQSGKAD